MVYLWYIIPILLATVVSADYYIDNANTSVVYSMPADSTEQPWATFSVSTKQLALSSSNSTGNYTILLDASNCYDQNYALGVCGTADNCFVQIPFTGSGITIYVFNAGLTGMTAGFSVDGGNSVSSSIQAPPPPNYQISNVSLYNIQGLPSGGHTIKMTLLDWNGGGTSMKFDYAYVNETFVASPANTSSTSSVTSTLVSRASSQIPTQTSAGNLAASHSFDSGSIVGIALGCLALVAVSVMAVLYWRKRRQKSWGVPKPESTFHVNPFLSEFGSPTLPSVPYSQQRPFPPPQQDTSISPLVRSAILSAALAAGNQSPSGLDQSTQSIRSEHSSAGFAPLCKQPPHGTDMDTHIRAGHIPDATSSLPNFEMPLHLTPEQAEVIDRLRLDNVSPETISRVIEGFVSSGGDAHDRNLARARSIFSAAPPPSYQTDG